MKNFIFRSLTSLILLPIFIASIYFAGIFFQIIIFLIIFISIYEINKNFKKNFLYYFLIFLIFLFGYSLFELRGNNIYSFFNLVWLLLIVMLTDTGGYVFGNLIGGKKLIAISPNKTISGFIGSLFVSQFSIIIFLMNDTFVFNIEMFLRQLFLSIIAIFGDLFFSYLKRKNSIKDYSNILPGHGGLLDRIDGMIFVIIISNLLNYV